MSEINLHELANTPGYGKAQDALKKAGLWDEKLIVDGETEFEFVVEVSGTQTFTVIAKTEDEAIDLAEGLSDFDDIEDVQIEDVREIT